MGKQLCKNAKGSGCKELLSPERLGAMAIRDHQGTWI